MEHQTHSNIEGEEFVKVISSDEYNRLRAIEKAVYEVLKVFRQDRDQLTYNQWKALEKLDDAYWSHLDEKREG